MTEEKARQSELYLVGMVCYYGKHYSTFFFQTKIRRWMYFDDAHVKEVCVHTGRNICSDRCVKRFPLFSRSCREAEDEFLCSPRHL